MKISIILWFLLLTTTANAATELKLGSTSVIFATVEQGREIIGSHDDYIQRLSPFDRSAKMKTDRDVTEETFVKYLAENVVPWPVEERTEIEAAWTNLQPALESFILPWPKTIYLVKTTGREEGDAAYTRANAIFFSAGDAKKKRQSLRPLIAHELFHVLSRQNPGLQEALYETIGFEKCNEITYPASLKSRKLTNPDAPKNDYCIRVRVQDQPAWVMPVLYSTAERYDTNRGGEFFSYIKFGFLAVDRVGTNRPVKVTFDDAHPRLLEVEDLSDYFEQIGKNTEYIIHPDEILADNFQMLITGKKNLPSPEVIDRMKKTFQHQTLPAK